MSIWTFVVLWFICGAALSVYAIIYDWANTRRWPISNKRDAKNVIKIVALGPIGIIAYLWSLLRT